MKKVTVELREGIGRCDFCRGSNVKVTVGLLQINNASCGICNECVRQLAQQLPAKEKSKKQ